MIKQAGKVALIKKISLILGLTIITTAIAVGGILYFQKDDINAVPIIEVTEHDIILEINEEEPDWKQYFSVTNNETEIAITDEMITSTVDMSKVGTYTVFIEVRNEKGSKATEQLSVAVKDTTAPQVNLNVTFMNVHIDTELDESLISCEVTDNSNEALDCEYDLSVVDTTKISEYEIEFSATDKSNNKGTSKLTISVVNQNTPAMLGDNSDIIVEINEEIKLPYCKAYDYFGEEIECVFDEVDTSILGETVLVATATDKYGNVRQETARVFVKDTIAPVIELGEYYPTISINADYVLPTCKVTDNSGEIIECEFSDIDFSTLGDKTIFVTARDSSGNVAKIEGHVRVIDETPPEIFVDESDIYVEVSQNIVLPICSVIDNSLEEITCEFSDVDTSSVGETTLTIKAIDFSKNLASKTIKVHVIDTTPPVIFGDGSDMIVEVGSTIENRECTVVDNSGETIECIFGTVDTSTIGTKILTVTAEDSSGNKTIEYVTVIVVNTTNPPTITIVDDKITVEVNEDITPLLPTCTAQDFEGNAVDCQFGAVDTKTVGNKVLTVTATDTSGNTGIVTIDVIVEDTIAPVINVDTSDIVIEVNTEFVYPNCFVTDNSKIDISCEMSPIDTSSIGNQLLTITAKDKSDNTTTKTINVTIQDTTGPTIIVDQSTIIVEAGEEIVLPSCRVTDNSNEIISCEFSDVDTITLGMKQLQVKATDNSGNKTIVAVDVFVIDTTVPIIEIDKTDIKVEYGQSFELPTCKVTDNSQEVIKCTFTNVDTDEVGVKTLTVTAQDNSGNQTSVTINIIVIDLTPPQINVESDEIIVELGSGQPNIGCIAVDEIDGEVSCQVENVDTSKLGEVTIKITAVDSSNNESNYYITVIVEDTTPPTVTIDTTPITVELGDKLRLPTCTATDLSGDVMCTFSRVDTNVIGEKTLWISAIDSSGNETRVSISVNVKDTTPPKIFVNDAPITAEINGVIEEYPNCVVSDNSEKDMDIMRCKFHDVDLSVLGKTELLITAVDQSGNMSYKKIEVNVIDTTPPVIIKDNSDIVVEVNTKPPVRECKVEDNSKEYIKCVVSEVDTSTTGTKIKTVTATDSSGNTTTEYINVIVINTTNPPVISVDKTPITVEVHEDITLLYPTCTATDVNGKSVDCIFGTVDTHSVGEKSLPVKAADEFNNTGLEYITVYVVDTKKPVISVDTTPIVVEVNETYITPYCEVTDNSNEVIECNYNEVDTSEIGSHTIIFTATDSSGNKADNVVIQVEVVDTKPPVIYGDNSDQYLEINSTPPVFDCSVIDNSGEQIDCVLTELDMSKLGLQVITATATDRSGNITTEFANIYIVDTIAPKITVDQSSITTEINGTINYPQCLVTDNSKEEINCTFKEVDLSTLGDKILKVTATDSSGNKTVVEIVITVVDTTAPEIEIDTTPVTVEVNDVVEAPSCSVTDNSKEEINCVFSLLDTSVIGQTVVYVTATDSSGNVKTVEVVVNVVDTTAPVINIDKSDIYVGVNETIDLPSCKVTDNSNEKIHCVFSPVNTKVIGDKVLTVTATDGSGNTTTKNIVVHVYDDLAPVINLHGVTEVEITLGDALNEPRCEVMDNSGDAISCVFGNVDITTPGEKLWSVTAVDKSGNTATEYITVIIRQGEWDFVFTETATEVTITGYIGTSKHVIIPDEIHGKPVTIIEAEAFRGKGLESVVLPTSLKEIKQSAFRDNNLTEIVIPEGVTNIGWWAFTNNILKTIHISSTVQTLGVSAFSNNADTLVDVTVAGDVNRFSSATWWLAGLPTELKPS